jgi:hypothetical protein
MLANGFSGGGGNRMRVLFAVTKMRVNNLSLHWMCWEEIVMYCVSGNGTLEELDWSVSRAT